MERNRGFLSNFFPSMLLGGSSSNLTAKLNF